MTFRVAVEEIIEEALINAGTMPTEEISEYANDIIKEALMRVKEIKKEVLEVSKGSRGHVQSGYFGQLEAIDQILEVLE